MDYFTSSLPIYFIFMGISWGIGYELSLFFLKRNKLPTKGFTYLFLGTFISSWIGAKLFFLLSSSGDRYSIFMKSPSFWLGGGFVFYGGLFLGIFFVFFYCHFLKRFSIFNLYSVLPAVCFSHAVGRIGCFFSGCCFGKICQLPWGIFKISGGRHPVQIYESLFLIGLGFYLAFKVIKIHKRPVKESFYYILTRYLAFYSLFRIFIEFLRGDKIRGIYYGFSTSQLASFSILFFLLILKLKRLNPRN